MDSEIAHVQMEDIARLKGRKRLTYLLDGWEDKIRRSLYGSMAAEVNQHPVVLSSADKLLEVSVKALEQMEIGDGHNIIAVTMDNPTTLPCFLHGLNTIIGEICAHPFMKKNVTKATRVVTFFNGSHYWGGQLKEQAKIDNVKRRLKKNCESRWYALILQSMSVRDHRYLLVIFKKIGGLSPVAPDVIAIVLRDLDFWAAIDQGIKVAKPIESRKSSLASCMIGLICVAKAISQLPLEESDNFDFWLHVKTVFNRRFFAMNTKIHTLALFLHPICRKLAISQFMVETALDVAKQWRWDEQLAKSLIGDLKEYYKCTGIFAGGQADALDWWETLPALAIIIHSIRYFSGLGGVQSVKRCNLSVHTFESLSKLRSSYAYFLYKMDSKAGKPVHRKHAHMHTRPERGLDVALADELQRSFAWIPPLATDSDDQDYLAGPESITEEEFERETQEAGQARENDAASGSLFAGDVPDVLDGGLIDWSELERVNKGITPTGFVEEIEVLNRSSDHVSGWNIDALLTSEGIASM
ncbi:hypothetical protein EV424DRAFT_1578558 [Suillus variegatus]|nr:hypothetical protein EV424DRAFT_1578558 [Suillus variegatus]